MCLSGSQGSSLGSWHTWISPSEFSGSYLLTLVCSPSPPQVPPPPPGRRPQREEGVNACV